MKNGANSAKDGSAQVASGIEGAIVGVNKLSENKDKLLNEASALNNGVSTFADGSNTLKNGAITLDDGVQDLIDGAIILSDGITTFNSDGIQKISNEVNGKLENTVERAKVLQDLSFDYNKFASDEERDAIKFISIINSIKNSAQDDSKENAIITESNIDTKADNKK